MIKLQGKIEEAHFAAISVPDSEGVEYGFYVKFDFGRAGSLVYNEKKAPIMNVIEDNDVIQDNHQTWLVMAEFLRAAKVKMLEELKNVFIIGMFNDKQKLVSVQFGLDEDAKEVLL